MKKKGNGFTLFELLITATVIFVLTGFILANYPSAGRGFALKRSTNKLAQDIWQVQSKAIIMERIQGSAPKGYGIYLTSSTLTGYKLFADQDSNWQWESAADTLVEDVSLESDVEISNLEAGGASVSVLNIVFQPPDPAVWINNSSSSSSTITLYLPTDPSKTGTIFVNSAGLITTQ